MCVVTNCWRYLRNVRPRSHTVRQSNDSRYKRCKTIFDIEYQYEELNVSIPNPKLQASFAQYMEPNDLPVSKAAAPNPRFRCPAIPRTYELQPEAKKS